MIDRARLSRGHPHAILRRHTLPAELSGCHHAVWWCSNASDGTWSERSSHAGTFAHRVAPRTGEARGEEGDSKDEWIVSQTCGSAAAVMLPGCSFVMAILHPSLCRFVHSRRSLRPFAYLASQQKYSRGRVDTASRRPMLIPLAPCRMHRSRSDPRGASLQTPSSLRPTSEYPHTCSGST